MPLEPDFADDYALLRQQVKDLQFQLAQAKVVEVTATAIPTESVIIPANADSGWQGLSGPGLDIYTASGKIAVTVSGRIEIGSANSNSQAGMSWEVSDEQGQRIIAPDLGRGIYAIYKGGMGAVTQSAFTFVHEGLAPGIYRVRTRYRYWDGVGGMGGTWAAEFRNRSLILKAY